MRLLGCGSRDWTDYTVAERELRRLLGDDARGHVFIHGANGNIDYATGRPYRGADLIMAEIAKGLGAEVLSFPAKWVEEGRAAGPLRNTRMLREGRPDRGLALGHLYKEGGGLRGTGDMVSKLVASGILVTWVYSPEASAPWDLTEMP